MVGTVGGRTQPYRTGVDNFAGKNQTPRLTLSGTEAFVRTMNRGFFWGNMFPERSANVG